jgi:hypothetical protein
MVEPGRPQMTIWRMRIACWTTKATHTNSECVILIAFPLQQWLNEGASILYVHCLSCFEEQVVKAVNISANWGVPRSRSDRLTS